MLAFEHRGALLFRQFFAIANSLKALDMIQAIAIVALSLMATDAGAADVAAGEAKAATCFACHGMDGISNNDQWPNLAGQKRGYLVSQLKAYRDGSRVNMMMQPMAKPLTDKDIEDLAAFFSSLQ
jgi:cytochrome c553